MATSSTAQAYHGHRAQCSDLDGGGRVFRVPLSSQSVDVIWGFLDRSAGTCVARHVEPELRKAILKRLFGDFMELIKRIGGGGAAERYAGALSGE